MKLENKKATIKNRYEYLIIETSCQFYSLILSDSHDLINIRSQKVNQIKPKKLKFQVGTKIFVQNFNSERVLVNLIRDEIIDIYNIFDLDQPMISYNIKNIFNNKQKEQFEILSFFFYEKLILLLCSYYESKETQQANNKSDNKISDGI